MLANVGQEHPAERIFVQRHRARDLISLRTVLFQKHHVPPGRCTEMSGVVVRISRPNEAVIRHLVPFFARDFASLTSNANSRVGKKSYFNVIAHVGVLPLIRTLNAFANHRLSIFPSKPSPPPALPQAATAAGGSGCKLVGPPFG